MTTFRKEDAIPGCPGGDATDRGAVRRTIEVMSDVDWKAHAARLTASTTAGCTTDGAMISRRAHWRRRGEILRLERKIEARKLQPFTFRARRPFHPTRLYVCMKSQGQASRCKLEGIAWLASRNDEHATVLHPPSVQLGSISTSVSIMRGPPWWASLDRTKWPDGLEEDLVSSPLWCETYGDRQVEIHVTSYTSPQIMPQLKQELIEAELSSCLLTDAELEEGPEAWDDLDDPFLEKEQASPFSFAGFKVKPLICRPCGPGDNDKVKHRG